VEAIDVLREAFGKLPRTRGRLTHPAPVTAAARNLGTNGLATGCADGSVCIWDGSVLRHIGGHPTRVHAVADLGNGRFVTGAADGTCGMWDWTSGERIAQFSAGTTVGRIDVRRQGERTMLMTCSGFAGQSGDVAIWTDAGQEVWRRGMVMQAALDASGAHVTLAWGDHVVTRRVDDGELVAKQPMNATVFDVATHPTQPMIAATTVDRRAHIILLTGSEPERRDLGDGISRVSPIRISPDGRYVAAVRDDFRALVWDLSDGSRRLFKYEGLMNISLQFSGDSRYLAVISPEATVITVWRLDDGQHVCTIEQDAAALALFDNQNAMWIGSDGVTASSIELPRLDPAAATASPGLATALAYGPDGSLAWSGYAVGQTCGWPVKSDSGWQTRWPVRRASTRRCQKPVGLPSMRAGSVLQLSRPRRSASGMSRQDRKSRHHRMLSGARHREPANPPSSTPCLPRLARLMPAINAATSRRWQARMDTWLPSITASSW
jgi:WD40 repeat protein